jgi:sigma-B regulation protein RsbU (phosphoserine phosphatase)
VPCGLAQTEVDGLFRHANRTFCAWLGYSQPQLVGRRKLQSLLTMGGRIFHQTHWTPLLQMQGSISEVKLELIHRDGHTIPMVMNAAIRDDGGHTVHELAAFVARDRDKYEKELLHSRKRLEELVADAKRLHEAAKDRALLAEQMMGIVSHDLRNPMSTIQMGAALLAGGDMTLAQRRTLGRITRAAERSTRLIADILDFTAARLGKGLSASLLPLELHDVIAECVEDLSVAYPGRALKHERSGHGACNADADRVAQLVGNLVSNAMAYGALDAPVVVTSTIGTGFFSVAVHNQGAPIPPEIQSSIFQAMSRGTNAGSAGRSVGLGLFIVSEIAKAHGGEAVVRSTAESGTTFSVIFPRT